MADVATRARTATATRAQTTGRGKLEPAPGKDGPPGLSLRASRGLGVEGLTPQWYARTGPNLAPPSARGGPRTGSVYGMSRQRLCARPGCGAPATDALAFHDVTRMVWLHDLGEPQPYAIDLCTRHADRLCVPRGWTGDDRRAARARPVSTPVAS